MLSYCLKCRKNMESKNLKAVSTKNGFYPNVFRVMVKNQHLSKRKRLVYYKVV